MSEVASVTITLPDGAQKQVPAGTTIADFVKHQIGPGLAKVALFAKYDDVDVDLSVPLDHDGSSRSSRPRTPRRSRSAPRRGAHRRVGRPAPVPRHAGDHRPFDRRRLLLRLPSGQAVHPRGPRGDREGGQRDRQAGHSVRRKEVSKDEALALFGRLGEKFKLEIIEDIFAKGAKTLSLYEHGDWVDFCLGPHGPSTGRSA
jgi:threonyl-tRNA synthetase